ncbi:MAG: pyridoxal-phosphate dependent enzyme [Sporomusaceae bacterium]|jgi:threonine dehydratase|nr:pyridoxal-phosphate dependent enzyme [Sporomusaceae bacterium]
MYDKIMAAATRVSRYSRRTPVITSRVLDKTSGNQVFLKCENFQSAGAFKFRGAYNAISLLTDEEKSRGVITFSSGNHAQSVALSSKIQGIKATVVVPKDVPKIKLDACKAYEARIAQYDPATDDREAMAKEIAEREGLVIIPPFNDENVIAGQGTVAKELLDEVFSLDYLFVPCGGGGLLSGCAIYAKHKLPNCKVIGVEPEKANDAYLSFKSGKIVTIDPPVTVADGLRARSVGDITFKYIQQYVDDIVTVTEDEIIEAMYHLWTRQKIVVEPSGSIALAPVLFKKIPEMQDKRVGVVLSGGNVDVIKAEQLFKRIVTDI